MKPNANTLFMRLAGPFQSWGTKSRLQIRHTDKFPSKSGVLGILLTAMGIPRSKSRPALSELSELMMGVRINRPGNILWDYHTTGAKVGVRTAAGKVKRTESTGELEVVLSDREYLVDADFLVALQGEPALIKRCVQALENPRWAPFLGRKSCIPSLPVFENAGTFHSLKEALSSHPAEIGSKSKESFAVWLEHPAGKAPPDNATLVYDVPVQFGYYNHLPRFIYSDEVQIHQASQDRDVPADNSSPREKQQKDDWRTDRKKRLEEDNYLCVFCKSEAVEVHHVSYVRDPEDPTKNLRSLCTNCHYACTAIEYSDGMGKYRVDPSDPEWRDQILKQVKANLAKGRNWKRAKIKRQIKDR